MFDLFLLLFRFSQIFCVLFMGTCVFLNFSIPITCTIRFGARTDEHLMSPYNVRSKSHITVTRKQEMITNYRSSWLLQILLVSTLEIVQRTVWRICILMLGCKGFKSCSFSHPLPLKQMPKFYLWKWPCWTKFGLSSILCKNLQCVMYNNWLYFSKTLYTCF